MSIWAIICSQIPVRSVVGVPRADLEILSGRLRSYLGSSVEYGSDLRLSGHPQLVYNNMAWAPGRV